MTRNLRPGINNLLEIGSHTARMRIAMATLVALLILNFVDEQYNDARYTRGAASVLSQIARSFS
jgi:hypothetical protein